MLFRPDRGDRSGPDPTLHLRILLFCFGAGCAMAGIYYGVRWLVTLGIVVLAAGVLLRLIGERRRRDAQEAAWRAQADEDAADSADEQAYDGPDESEGRSGPH